MFPFQTHTAQASMIIAHATDLRPDGGVAFEHSVALARQTGATLYSIHANPSVGRRPIPDAMELQRRWGDIRPVEHHRVHHQCCDDTVDSLLDALDRLGPDMLVVGTHQRQGLERMIKGCVSEALTLSANVPTLLVPIGQSGFVSAQTGQIDLYRVLAPVEDLTASRAVIDALMAFVAPLGLVELEVLLLHVGKDAPIDGLDVPQRQGWRWRWIYAQGDVEDEVLWQAQTHNVDMVVMATRGQDSLLDVLRGTHTQNIIRAAPCPVLAVPIKSAQA